MSLRYWDKLQMIWTLPICFYLMVNSGGTRLQAVRRAQTDNPSRDRYQQHPSYHGAWTVVPKHPLHRERHLTVREIRVECNFETRGEAQEKVSNLARKLTIT